MWRIVGLCKKTLRFTEVATASSPAEKERILDEEREAYWGLTAIPIHLRTA